MKLVASIIVTASILGRTTWAQHEPQIPGYVVCRAGFGFGPFDGDTVEVQSLPPDGTAVDIDAVMDRSATFGEPTIAEVSAELRRWSDGVSYNKLHVSCSLMLVGGAAFYGQGPGVASIARPNTVWPLPNWDLWNESTGRLLVFTEMSGLFLGPLGVTAECGVGDTVSPASCDPTRIHLTNNGFGAYYRAGYTILDPQESACLLYEDYIMGLDGATNAEGDFLLEILPVLGTHVSGSCTMGPTIPLMEVAGSATPGGSLRVAVETEPSNLTLVVMGIGVGAIQHYSSCRPMLGSSAIVAAPIIADGEGRTGVSLELPMSVPIGTTLEVQAFIRTSPVQRARAYPSGGVVSPWTRPLFAASDIVRLTVQ